MYSPLAEDEISDYQTPAFNQCFFKEEKIQNMLSAVLTSHWERFLASKLTLPG